MATITATTVSGSGVKAVTVTTLTGTDAFTYNTGKDALLILNNVTAGGLTVTIDGDGGATVPVSGIGDVSVASGYSTGTIAAGAVKYIKLDTIRHYLQGTIAVTGGTGIEAILLEF